MYLKINKYKFKVNKRLQIWKIWATWNIRHLTEVATRRLMVDSPLEAYLTNNAQYLSQMQQSRGGLTLEKFTWSTTS